MDGSHNARRSFAQRVCAEAQIFPNCQGAPSVERFANNTGCDVDACGVLYSPMKNAELSKHDLSSPIPGAGPRDTESTNGGDGFCVVWNRLEIKPQQGWHSKSCKFKTPSAWHDMVRVNGFTFSSALNPNQGISSTPLQLSRKNNIPCSNLCRAVPAGSVSCCTSLREIFRGCLDIFYCYDTVGSFSWMTPLLGHFWLITPKTSWKQQLIELPPSSETCKGQGSLLNSIELNHGKPPSRLTLFGSSNARPTFWAQWPSWVARHKILWTHAILDLFLF